MKGRNKMEFGKILGQVRAQSPLVQCITNFVTVNDCANIILAAGGSASMSHDVREVAQSVCGADGLVCNLGAIEEVDSMVLAGRQANRLKKPVIFDPVAVGRTQLRSDAAKRLLEEVQFTVIRGNASEIRYLAGQKTGSGGVDVCAPDEINRENLSAAAQMIKALAQRTGSVIAVSGALDLVSNGERTVVLKNGCPTMARITGSGCMLSALMGTFCAVAPQKSFEAVCAAMAAMGVCGEMAEQRRLQNGTGNATFRNDLIDAVFNLTQEQLTKLARYECFD